MVWGEVWFGIGGTSSSSLKSSRISTDEWQSRLVPDMVKLWLDISPYETRGSPIYRTKKNTRLDTLEKVYGKGRGDKKEDQGNDAIDPSQKQEKGGVSKTRKVRRGGSSFFFGHQAS